MVNHVTLGVTKRLARESLKRCPRNLPVVLFYMPISIDNHRFISSKDHPQPDRERCSTKVPKVRGGQVQVGE